MADSLVTGKWVRSGKGKNATTEFVVTASFTAGDEVVIQGAVADRDAEPLAGAPVTMAVQDANATAVATLVSTASDSLGRFELRWQTQKPNKKGAGGTPAGSYTAVTTDVQLNGYSWDGVMTSAGLALP